MNRLLLRVVAVLIIAAVATDGFAQVHVRGYFRKNGTYVAPHYRSAPDGNFYNNWSTKGNVNPYTGKEGTRISPSNISSGSRVNYDSVEPVEGLTVQAPSRPVEPRMDVPRVQTKLKELGYYRMSVDGIWGPGSREALRSYKTTHNLGNDDAWNVEVESLLFGTESRAQEEGIWVTTVKEESGDSPFSAIENSPVDPRGIYQHAVSSYTNRDWPAAFQYFSTYHKSWPNSDMGGNAQYWMGDCLLHMEKYTDAIRVFEAMRSTYKTNAKIPFAMLNQAVAHAGLGQSEKAEELMLAIIDQYPTSSVAEQAKSNLTTLRAAR